MTLINQTGSLLKARELQWHYVQGHVFGLKFHFTNKFPNLICVCVCVYTRTYTYI